MKRVALLLIALSLLVFGTSLNVFAAAKVFKVAVGEPDGTEQGALVKAFKKYVEEKSNGRYKVELYFASALGDESETLHNVRAGTLDMSITGIAQLVPFVNQLDIYNFPYMFKDLDDMVACTTGEVFDFTNAYAIKSGFRVLGWSYTGWRNISNSSRPITKMDDIKGLKFRVPGSSIILAVYKALGASPVPINWSELFTSLQQGVVDGHCNGYILNKAMKFEEAGQKYLTEVHYAYQLQPLVISERLFRKLSPEDQKMFVAAGKYGQEEALKFQITEGEKAKQATMKAGVQISQLEDEAEWAKVLRAKVWPEMADFVGGKDAINAFLKIAGKQPWNP